MPTVRPRAISNRVIMATVEPLPLVPVTWMTGIASCGSPIALQSLAIGSTLGLSTRPVLS